MRVVREGFRRVIAENLRRSTERVVVVSPFVSWYGIRLLTEFKRKKPNAVCQLLTRKNLDDFSRNASNLDALIHAIENGIEVKSLAELHGKVYLFDEACSIVTSANLTQRGMCANVEWGIQSTYDECREVFDDVLSVWSRLPNQMTRHELQAAQAKILAYREEHPLAELACDDRLDDEGQVLHALRDRVAFASGIDRNTCIEAMSSIEERHEKFGQSDDYALLRGCVIDPQFDGITVSTFCWLAAWCDTGGGWRGVMESVRDLTVKLFGYRLESRFLQKDGAKFDLGRMRRGQQPAELRTLTADIIDQHCNRQSLAE